MDPVMILQEILEDYKVILNDNMLGFYLHGSLAMGCYTNKSDIDFLVVVEKEIEFTDKRKLIDVILKHTDVPEKGIEMSIVLKRDVKEFVYPTPFELHYSDFHKKWYTEDNTYVAQGEGDKDLAAHITITRDRGECLYGSPIKEIFGTVPPECYKDAIISDIEDAQNDILDEPVYIILNLCRVMCYIQEGKITSKKEGGEWGLNNLPSEYAQLVEKAYQAYTTDNIVTFSDESSLKDYADYMLKKIMN